MGELNKYANDYKTEASNLPRDMLCDGVTEQLRKNI